MNFNKLYKIDLYDDIKETTYHRYFKGTDGFILFDFINENKHIYVPKMMLIYKNNIKFIIMKICLGEGDEGSLDYLSSKIY